MTTSVGTLAVCGSILSSERKIPVGLDTARGPEHTVLSAEPPLVALSRSDESCQAFNKSLSRKKK